jgi:hypothetical protein
MRKQLAIKDLDDAMNAYSAFQARALEKFGAQDGEVDYAAMAASPSWDRYRTLSLVQLLDAHILDVQRLKTALMDSLGESARRRLQEAGY